jgi:geranylgeranylglycerol-phosphate geranylgeranyltransferase
MGSFAINDYFDVELDTENMRFDRPLVSKAMSKRSALVISYVSFSLGVIAAFFINIPAFIIAFIFAFLAAFYSYKLKETLLIGNVYVAFSMAIPFIFGNYVVSYVINPNVLIISVIILSSGLAREIHGMIRDFKGDRKIRDLKSVPYYIGIKESSLVAFGLYIVAILLSIFMFFFLPPFHSNLFYLFAIAIVDAVLIYVNIGYLSLKGIKNRKKMFKLSRNLSLAAMSAALIIFLLSNFIYI